MRQTVFGLAVTILTGATLLAQAPAHKPAAKAGASAGDQAKIKLAMTAAPADVSAKATIMEPDAKGQMRTLRAGTNGWTCMPSAGGAAGAAGADPMCFDSTWMGWADAWMHKTDPPPVTKMGVGYMLRGDKGASNTDPFATGPTADNHWVVSPSHTMLLVPDPKMLDALPSDPHAGGAWVMWKGTKYAHIMVPNAAVPATK